MTNRQLAARHTREKLLEEGGRLIAERGLSGISVEDITAACGVAKGTFYTYFKNKEEIVGALAEKMFGEVLEGAKAQPGGAAEKIARYLCGFSGWIERSGLRLAQEWVRSVTDPARADPSKLEKDLADMNELLSFCAERGLLREDMPLRALARTLTDVLYGQLLCWCMQGGVPSLQGRAQKFCEGALPALLKEYLS
mgnify:FL=1